jgi:type II secretory pathway pseudopilin PulG
MMKIVASYKLQVQEELQAPSCKCKSTLATPNLPLALATCTSPGFTFIEVLFAVILLGIGFIMIAGVFPVAIQQTAAVSDETQGTAIARDAIKKIQAVADSMGSNALFPATGSIAAPQVWAITTNPASNNMLTTPGNNNGLMAALGADSFFTADHRYGWVGFYRRDSITSPFAQVYVIALQNPNFPNYLYTSVANTIPGPIPPPVPPSTYGNSPLAAPTAAKSIQAAFFYNQDGTTTVVLQNFPTYSASTGPGTGGGGPNGATGAFLLVADTNSGTPANLVGRFFRLGNAASTAVLPSGYTLPSTPYQIFTLQPGWDITPADNIAVSTGSPAFTPDIWLMGAAPMPDPGGSGEFTGPFSGPNQDIGVASAFIRVNTANN